MKRGWRRILEPVGTLLALGGVAAIGWRMHHAVSAEAWSHLTPKRLGLLVILTLMSAVAPLALARGWGRFLAHLGVAVPATWVTRVYVRSHLARYIPGNVFQFAGRQAAGLAVGLPGVALAKSAVVELAGLAGVGAALCVLASPLLLPHIPQPMALGTTLTLLAVALGLARRFQSPALMDALLFQALFLVYSAWLSVAVLFVVGHPPLTLLVALLGAQVAAWLVGLLVPGAPAGLGVREAALVWLLRGQMPEADILLGAVFSRLVTMVGDVLCLAWTLRQPVETPHVRP